MVAMGDPALHDGASNLDRPCMPYGASLTGSKLQQVMLVMPGMALITPVLHRRALGCVGNEGMPA